MVKKIVLLLLGFIGGSLAQAQQNVVLHFNHLIDTEPLEINTGKVYTTSNGIYNFSRLQYYISGIELVHDGGQVMPLTNTYVLVDGRGENYHLGTHQVTTIEEIRFDVGVDQAHNHLDPTTYLLGHPLAPQVPSMHWGWTAGYVFWAVEGEAAASNATVPNAPMNFHAIGDQYLTDVHLLLQNATVTNGNTTTIHVNADYNHLFVDVDMANMRHGQGGPLDSMMNNLMHYNVFTADNLSSVDKKTALIALNISPNPATVQSLITYHFDSSEFLSLVITDPMGRVIKQWVGLQPKGQLELPVEAWETGIYHYSFFAKNQLLATGKLLIN